MSDPLNTMTRGAAAVARPGQDASTAAQALKLVAVGFQPNERRLLEGTVLLSQRRNPRLALLKDTEAEQADAVLVDTADRRAMAWAKERPWLSGRTVIWVDGTASMPANHIALRRPVQWPALPMTLARAMDENARDLQRRAAGATDFVSTSVLREQLVLSASNTQQKHAVLVCDDSLAVRSHLQSLLGNLGLSVTAVADGEAAVNAVDARSFECVLMDVLMPGMDGYEACRRIKAKHRSGKGPSIVMLTSKSSPFDRIRGKMAGCDAYLTKPVDAVELHTTLSKYLALNKPRQASSAVPLGQRPLRSAT